MNIRYDEDGLIPTIVQDALTNQVLMLAYMNAESLKKTVETGKTWFYSRSRKSLWNKGETSGNFQRVVSIDADCDQDTLLVKVIPEGPACHTGAVSCFFEKIQDFDEKSPDRNMLYKLYDIVMDRKENPSEGSYTNYLFNKGVDKICKKIGEEATETVIAAKNNSHEELTYEASDLLYHLCVLLINQGVALDDLMVELEKRHARPKE